MQYRKLQDDDLHALDAFLATHAETSMVLRSNLRKTGMNRRHHPLSGCYYGEVSSDGTVTVPADADEWGAIGQIGFAVRRRGDGTMPCAVGGRDPVG